MVKSSYILNLMIASLFVRKTSKFLWQFLWKMKAPPMDKICFARSMRKLQHILCGSVRLPRRFGCRLSHLMLMFFVMTDFVGVTK